MSAQQPEPARDWEQRDVAAAGKTAVIRTGPSGLLLGTSSTGGNVTIRLFRTRPTRVLANVPDYVKWTLAFRAATLGAHLSILTDQPRAWASLTDVIRGCGGTVDVLDDATKVPGQGRAYRPSLVIDDLAKEDGSRMSLGAWQAVLIIADVSAPAALHALRTCDLSLVSPCDARAAENLRRGYGLNASQQRQLNNLATSEVVVAMPRRVMRVALPPTPTEYRLLFGG